MILLRWMLHDKNYLICLFAVLKKMLINWSERQNCTISQTLFDFREYFWLYFKCITPLALCLLICIFIFIYLCFCKLFKSLGQYVNILSRSDNKSIYIVTKKQKYNNGCSFAVLLSMHPEEKNHCFHKNIKQQKKTVFNIISYDDNKICNNTKCSLTTKSANYNDFWRYIMLSWRLE